MTRPGEPKGARPDAGPSAASGAGAGGRRIFQTGQIEGQALQAVRLIRTGELPAVLPTSGLGGIAIQVIDGRGAVASGTGDLPDQARVSDVVPPSDRVTSSGTWCDLPGVPGCTRMVVVRVHQPDGDWFVYAFAKALP